jgi:predicted outer membrane repeat protein
MSDNAQIYENGAYNGGGVYGGVTMSDNAQIHDNTAQNHGGGIYRGSSAVPGCIPGAEEDGANVFDNTPDDIYPPLT